MQRRGPRAGLALILLALLCVLGLVGCAATATAPATTSLATTAAAASASRAPAGGSASAAGALAPVRATTALRTVRVGSLPPEAVTTLQLIAAGGPFPYAKDGATFGNREGILPKRQSGFYEEYTVVTPGEGDRGARRIVAGADGSRFYTADHYASFREVVQ